MGKSAKLTRGGNKKRVNVGRQEAKAKAHQLATTASGHSTKKAAHKARASAPKREVMLERKVALKKAVKQQTIVKMAAKPPAAAPSAAPQPLNS
jgi:hypothetical protein